jgi:hypothetical protein
MAPGLHSAPLPPDPLGTPRPATDSTPMLALLAAAAVTAFAPSPLPSSSEEPRWTAIVAYDEVRVEMDTTRVLGSGPYATWVRWHFLDRVSSPAAWDAGVRASLDLLEVDCVRGATRTLSSTAYAVDGTVNASHSVDEPAAAWRAVRPGTIGAELAARVCAVARR